MPQRLIIIMGVAGSGKTTLGEAVARELNLPFLEGDQFHSPASIAKMTAGLPLNDEDRWPWLESMAAALKDSEDGAVLACSALKRVYRERLRAGAGHPLQFVWINVDRARLAERMAARKNHYMPASLLESQLATLEPPNQGESDVIALPGAMGPKKLLATALQAIAARPPP